MADSKAKNTATDNMPSTTIDTAALILFTI